MWNVIKKKQTGDSGVSYFLGLFFWKDRLDPRSAADQSEVSIFRAGWPESLSFPQAFDSTWMKSFALHDEYGYSFPLTTERRFSR